MSDDCHLQVKSYNHSFGFLVFSCPVSLKDLKDSMGSRGIFRGVRGSEGIPLGHEVCLMVFLLFIRHITLYISDPEQGDNHPTNQTTD